jgi:hypothetical protein
MASAWLQNSKIKPSGESQIYAQVSLRKLFSLRRMIIRSGVLILRKSFKPSAGRLTEEPVGFILVWRAVSQTYLSALI